MIIAKIVAILLDVVIRIVLPCAVVYWIITAISGKATADQLREYDRKQAEKELDEIEKELNSNETNY